MSSLIRTNDPGGVTVKPATTQQAAKVDFARDVRRFSRQSCYGCRSSTPGGRFISIVDGRRAAARSVIGPGASEGSRMYLRLIGLSSARRCRRQGALSENES
jgi:hypothetical protein